MRIIPWFNSAGTAIACMLLTVISLGGTRVRSSGAGLSQHEMATNMVHLISVSEIPLPVAVAEANGFFAKHGIMVHAEKVQEAERLQAAILEGSADIAEAPIENLISMVDSSRSDAVIIMGGESLTGELIVQPRIRSVSDLRGKTIILANGESLYNFGVRKILLLNKLKPGTDCNLKAIGPAPERLQAMILDKDYAATFEEPPIAVMAERAGLMTLGPVAKLLKMGPTEGIVTFAQRQWTYQHADLVKAYIAGYVEAQRWLVSPTNKRAAIESMAKEFRLPLDISEGTYEKKAQIANGWAKDARFDIKGFQNDLKLWREFHDPGSGKRPAAEKYYDLSFYREALPTARTPQ